MVERRDSPDGETWLLLLNAVDTAGALDKAVELMERSRAEGHGSEVRARSSSNNNDNLLGVLVDTGCRLPSVLRWDCLLLQ